MELKFIDGKYVPTSYGGLQTVSGREELLQRALMRLSARRGAFFLLPDFGSSLHTLFSVKKSRRAGLAQRMVYEALAPESALNITGVSYHESDDGTATVKVSLQLADGGSGSVSLSVNA